MQELVYCLSYVLKHMDLMRNWIDIKVDIVSVCAICVVMNVKVWITLCGIAKLIQSAMQYI